MGRVASRNRLVPRLLTPLPNWSGYYRVEMGKGNRHSLAKLVLEAFAGPRPTAQHQAAHQNGVRADNRFENLAWKTPVENCADRERHGTQRRGSNHPNAKVTEALVVEIRARAEEVGVRRGTCTQIAEEYGLRLEHVYDLIHRRSWVHIA